MFWFRPIGKKERKRMAKNEHKRGKSMRNGNAPSPYTKYNKKPYKYSFKTTRTDAVIASVRGKIIPPKQPKKVYLQAAE